MSESTGAKILELKLDFIVTRLLLDPVYSVNDIVSYLKAEHDVDIDARTIKAFEKNYVKKKDAKELQEIKDSIEKVQSLVNSVDEQDGVLEIVDLTQQIETIKGMIRTIETFYSNKITNTRFPPDIALYKGYLKMVTDVQELISRKQSLVVQAGYVDAVLDQFGRELMNFLDRKEVDSKIQEIVLEGLTTLIPDAGGLIKKFTVGGIQSNFG